MFSNEQLIEFFKNNEKTKIYKNGTVWNTNNYGKLEIIGKFSKTKHVCKFLNTGTITTAKTECIKAGAVKDYNLPTIYGKGFMGQGIYSFKTHKQIYQRWFGIIQRCYSEKRHKLKPTYKGCEVCEDWLNFQNFAKDIELLMKEMGLKNLDGYVIDKDSKIQGNKKYSKETISFISPSENSIERLLRNPTITGKTYKGIRLIDRYEEEFVNQAEFARKYNLEPRRVSDCLLNKLKSIDGWIFETVKLKKKMEEYK